jgi:chemotaxis protein methyltransferase CheR
LVATELPAPALERLAQRVEAETGLQFAAGRRRDLGSAVRRMALAKGFGAEHALVDWLLAGAWDREKADLCARHLTIGETYFFREPRGLELLCDYARRKVGAGGAAAPLRLWSAGCCTGEEPYSMAMALRQAVPQLDPARLSILATDLNEANLEVARAAVYRQWSFRRTDPALRAAHFSALGGGRYLLRREIREQVRFAQLNLALPSYPSAATGTEGIDIIFCRNVLMYFSRRQMKLVIERLRACLVDGGWLVVNPSEASSELFAGFTATCYPDAIFYRKTGDADTRSAHPARPGPAPSLVQAPRPPAPAAPRPPVRAASAGAPAAGPAAVLQAQALARAGDTEGALRGLLRAANHLPLVPELYQAAAQIALDQGDCAGAQRHLKRQLYLDPGSILAHYLSAVAHMGEGRPAAALRQFRTAGALLAALPDDAPVPGADGWQVAGLRASVRAWIERAA